MAIDTRNFELLLRAERPRLVKLCANLTQSHAAEDLAQETLIEAWRHRAKLVDQTGYAPWPNAITRNVCLRWMRQHGRHSTQVIDSLEPGDESKVADASQDPIDLEIELEREELITLLDRAMALLPAETRDALVYRYVAELPQAQIAERLHVSEGAVEARLRPGKLTLHRILVTDMDQEATELGIIERG